MSDVVISFSGEEVLCRDNCKVNKVKEVKSKTIFNSKSSWHFGLDDLEGPFQPK